VRVLDQALRKGKKGENLETSEESGCAETQDEAKERRILAPRLYRKKRETNSGYRGCETTKKLIKRAVRRT